MISPDVNTLTAMVGALLGRSVCLGPWEVVPTGFTPTAISTAAVLRVRGTAFDGDHVVPWSVFVKVLQSPRHWSRIDMVPTDLRQEVIDTFPWRAEADVLRSRLPSTLPPGMRTPRVLRIEELGDDRIALWLEDIRTADVRWDLDRFVRAARLLGRLAGRWSCDAIPAELRSQQGLGLRMLATNRLARGVFPLLHDDRVWAQPVLSTDPLLRRDLIGLSQQVPALLDRLDTLPQAVGHGDACPQNLLVPADAPDTFVAIDISLVCTQAIGFDLGQLLVGLAHEGRLTVAELLWFHKAVIPAYTAGMTEEGCDVDEADVAYGCDASMLLRSGFTAIPFERLAEPFTPELERHLCQRIALTRYLVDVGTKLVDQPSTWAGSIHMVSQM